jgi:hypothetical protein
MNVGRLLIYVGLAKLGRLPGDVVYRGNGTTVYFPIVTCIVTSVLLTVVVSLVGRFWTAESSLQKLQASPLFVQERSTPLLKMLKRTWDMPVGGGNNALTCSFIVSPGFELGVKRIESRASFPSCNFGTVVEMMKQSCAT